MLRVTHLTIKAASGPRALHARLRVFVVIQGIVFALLVGRLWMLQVVHGEQYAQQALSNHLKEREIPAPRGVIYDAHGERIADVEASFSLAIAPEDVASGGAESTPAESLGELPVEPLPERLPLLTLAERLAPLLHDVSAADLVEAFEERRGVRHRPVLVRADLDDDEVAKVMAARVRLPGVSVLSSHRRSYPDRELFAHLVGYLREVRRDELDALRARYAESEWGADHYQAGDRIGKYGLEAAYEDQLKGQDGTYWVQVDAVGRELGRSTPPDIPGFEYYRSIAHFLDRAVEPERAGHDLHLTVRRDLQQLATELLEGESGAVVMMDVRTGRLLVLANAPSFDPGIFSRRISPEAWKALSEDPRHPLRDKALQGTYPPGSTYKMVVAAAALGSGTWTPHTTVTCNGRTKVGNRQFHCWNRHGHGTVNLKAALKGSCDVYFYKAGLAMGIDTVARYADQFGFGHRSGVGINSESRGINPSTDWKRKRYKGRGGTWTPGDTASAVIGQGYTSVTPMQLTVMTAAVANGGQVLRPQLVDHIVDADGRVVQSFEPEVLRRVDLSEEYFQAIREGMFAVVDERGGTAHRQYRDQLAFAGKTGSAQVVRLGASRAKKFRDHAWFVGFAPYDKPEVAVTVLVEHGEHGSSAAAPVARKLFEAYFADRMAAAKEAGLRVGAPPRREADDAP